MVDEQDAVVEDFGGSLGILEDFMDAEVRWWSKTSCVGIFVKDSS